MLFQFLDLFSSFQLRSISRLVGQERGRGCWKDLPLMQVFSRRAPLFISPLKADTILSNLISHVLPESHQNRPIFHRNCSLVLNSMLIFYCSAYFLSVIDISFHTAFQCRCHCSNSPSLIFLYLFDIIFILWSRSRRHCKIWLFFFIWQIVL